MPSSDTSTISSRTARISFPLSALSRRNSANACDMIIKCRVYKGGTYCLDDLLMNWTSLFISGDSHLALFYMPRKNDVGLTGRNFSAEQRQP